MRRRGRLRLAAGARASRRPAEARARVGQAEAGKEAEATL